MDATHFECLMSGVLIQVTSWRAGSKFCRKCPLQIPTATYCKPAELIGNAVGADYTFVIYLFESRAPLLQHDNALVISTMKSEGS